MSLETNVESAEERRRRGEDAGKSSEQQGEEDEKEDMTGGAEAASGCVGSLDHVLKKTFKEFYNEGGEDDEKVTHEQDKEATKQSASEPKQIAEQEEEMETETDQVDNGEEAAEAGAAMRADDAEENAASDSTSSHEDAVVGLASSRSRPSPPVENEESPESLGNPEILAELSAIEAELRNRLRDASKLERYLERQRSQSQLEDMREAKEIYAKGLLVGAEFPVGRSHYELSQDQLSSFGSLSSYLLIASQVMDRNEESDKYKRGLVKRGVGEVCQIRPTTPNYQKPKEKAKCKELEEREKREEEERKGEEETSDDANAQPKSTRRKRKFHGMSATAAEENDKILHRMQKQISFLKNPRFVHADKASKDWRVSLLNKDGTEPPTFSQRELVHLDDCKQKGFLESDFQRAAAKSRKTSPPLYSPPSSPHGKGTEKVDHSLSRQREAESGPTKKATFSVSPSHARFADYTVNQVSEMVLSFCNVDKVSRSVRFLPPTTKYFSIAHVEYSSGSAVIAPGMSCKVHIEFCPDSLADYKDSLTICTETEKFRVALIAERKAPRLTLKEELECGSCFVGDSCTTKFTCTNLGGEGKFQILSEEQWLDPEAELDNRGKLSLEVGEFNVSPLQFNLGEGEAVDLRVDFQPEELGRLERTFIMVCDNCQVQRFVLRGHSCQVQVKVTCVGDTRLDLANRLIKQPAALLFDPTTIGMTAERRVTYLNPTPLALSFRWEILRHAPPAKKGASSKKLHAAGRLVSASDDTFSISPKEGILPPGAEMEFTVQVAPRLAKQYEVIAQMVIENIPASSVTPELLAGAGKKKKKEISATARSDYDATSSRASTPNQGESEQRGTSELLDIPCSKLVLSGSGSLPSADISPAQVLHFTKPLGVLVPHSFSVDIKNTCSAPIDFEWTGLNSETARFTPGMLHGTIPVAGSLAVPFEVVAMVAGGFDKDIECILSVHDPSGKIRDAKSCKGVSILSVAGFASAPKVRLLSQEIDLGLIGVEGRATAVLPVKNIGDVPAKVSFRQLTEAMVQALSVSGSDSKDTASIQFEPSELVLEPLAEGKVTLCCTAGLRPERLRRIAECAVALGSSEFIRVRGEIQSPKVFIEKVSAPGSMLPAADKRCSLDLGTTYVTVPVTRMIRMVNISNLPAAFRWSEISAQQPQSQKDPHGKDGANKKKTGGGSSPTNAGEAPTYEVVFSNMSGTLGPKEERIITITYTPRKAGRVSTLFACDVEGMQSPLGFTLKTLTKGLVVTFSLVGPEVTAADMKLNKEPKDSEPAGAAGKIAGADMEKVTKLPVLDFGSDVDLCKRKTLRLCFTNHSAIRAEYSISIKSFPAPCVPPSLAKRVAHSASASSFPSVPGTALTSDSSSVLALRGVPSAASRGLITAPENSSSSASLSTAPTTTSGSVTSSINRSGSRALLSDDHEASSVFSSENGKAHAMARITAKEDKAVLAANQGVAFLALPANGFLEPWQSVIVDVVCFNNMSGTYRSELACVIEGLPLLSTPLKVNVVGSPLRLQSNTVGLVMKNAAPAPLPAQQQSAESSHAGDEDDPVSSTEASKRKKLKPATACASLHFGHALVGTEPCHKVIKVVNDGPIPSKLSWRVVPKRASDADMVQAKIHVDEVPNRAAPGLNCSLTISLHPDLTNQPPFTVLPAEQVVMPHSSASFRVSYVPDSNGETNDEAYIVADSEWLDDSSRPEGSCSGSNASQSQASFNSLVASVVTLSGAAASGASRSGAMKSEGSGMMPPGSADQSISGSLSNSSLASALSSVAPGKSRRDALKSFLKVELAASSVRPVLSLDRTQRGPNLRQFLGFVAWSTRTVEHTSFFKTLTLSNSSPTRLPCVLFATPPFYIASCKTSSFGDQSISGKEIAALDLLAGSPGADHHKVCLLPGATLVTTLHFRPPSLVSTAHDVNDRLRTTLQGTFEVRFVNGDSQSVDLEGTVVEPAIVASPACYDFGRVHVETSQRATIKLSNPTVVPAHWRIQHVPAQPVLGLDDSTGTSDVKRQPLDDPSCWSFDVEENVLNGPTLPLSSANCLAPQGFDSDGKRLPYSLNVCFSPSVEEPYESRFRITVSKGVSFVLLMRGHGSYSEEDDRSVKRLPAPALAP